MRALSLQDEIGRDALASLTQRDNSDAEMTTLVKLAVALAAVYVFVVLLMALAQDRLLFPRWAMAPGPATLPAFAERLSIKLAFGDELAGLLLRAEERPPDGAALILGFGGNAWDADLLASHLHSLFPHRDVVTFHYRGYGPSTGQPSAQVLLDDAVRLHDEIAATLEPARIIAVGLSLGTGPAAHLASQRPLAGVILVTPFDSLAALAGDLYPWLPVRLLLRHRMEVASALANTSVPVAVIAAGQDEVVPPRRTEALRRSVDGLVLDRIVPGAGHNDVYGRPEYVSAMRDALALIEAAPLASGREP
jgi:pimeloyl-ACP methyl ester carboxylesterase